MTASFSSIWLPLAMLIACHGHASGPALTPALETALHGFAFPCSEQKSDEGIGISCETFASRLWAETSVDRQMRSLTMVAERT
ncbi:MAG TPA: hypothetical protein VH143_03680 [Kofleriaceae bacterium]|jgi:hypothetical protein|nr:hypothetical protein [Kofleriaceae bacterium]